MANKDNTPATPVPPYLGDSQDFYRDPLLIIVLSLHAKNAGAT